MTATLPNDVARCAGARSGITGRTLALCTICARRTAPASGERVAHMTPPAYQAENGTWVCDSQIVTEAAKP
jgi:hypothetical protein